MALEIVRVHMCESEHRVAHLVLSSLTAQYPEDPYIWNTMAKLYLDIGKRQNAAEAFTKSEEAMAKRPGVSADFVAYMRHFAAYLG